MVVILVHWLIKKGREKDFENWWRRMSVPNDVGLYREILTKLDADPPDSKFTLLALEIRSTKHIST